MFCLFFSFLQYLVWVDLFVFKYFLFHLKFSPFIFFSGERENLMYANNLLNFQRVEKNLENSRKWADDGTAYFTPKIIEIDWFRGHDFW